MTTVTMTTVHAHLDIQFYEAYQKLEKAIKNPQRMLVAQQSQSLLFPCSILAHGRSLTLIFCGLSSTGFFLSGMIYVRFRENVIHKLLLVLLLMLCGFLHFQLLFEPRRCAIDGHDGHAVGRDRVIAMVGRDA